MIHLIYLSYLSDLDSDLYDQSERSIWSRSWFSWSIFRSIWSISWSICPMWANVTTVQQEEGIRASPTRPPRWTINCGSFNLVTTKAVCYAGLFFEVANSDFFSRSILVLPRKERKSSRLFSEWVWLLAERYPGHFPASRLSQLREFRTSSFSIFLLEKSWSNRAPILINCQFSDYTIEKWASPKFSQLRLSRSGKLICVTLRE